MLIFAVAAAMIMLSGLLCFDAVAQSNTFEVRMMNYNVAGLPKFNGTDAAAECSFEFTVTEDFVENSQNLEVVKVPFFRNFLKIIKWIFKDLIYIFSNIDELIEFIS